MWRIRRNLILLGLGVSLASIWQSGLALGESRVPPVAMLDGPHVLRQSPEHVQAVLGKPERTRAVAPDDFQLPTGGTFRVYRDRGMQVEVDFEREQSTTVVIEFSNLETAPRSYEGALNAINLPVSRQPDVTTRDTREWHDLRGYFIRVVAAYPTHDHIDTIIVSVYPFN